MLHRHTATAVIALTSLPLVASAQTQPAIVDSRAWFAGPVAEHHDGFSMSDGKVNAWNSVAKGPPLNMAQLHAQAVRCSTASRDRTPRITLVREAERDRTRRRR